MEPTNLRLISAISSILDQAGITVEQATSDADTFVFTALELADSGEAVVLVGTDADVLVMLSLGHTGLRRRAMGDIVDF